MFPEAVSRRTLLKRVATVGTGAALAQLPGLAGWKSAQAATRADRVVSTYCGGCTNCCAIQVHVRNGRPWKVTGHPDNNVSAGKVCTRGEALLTEMFNPDRLTHPLKRVGDRFEPIAWDQAYAEIGTRLQAITGAYGPGAVFWADNPRPVKFYGDRFMAALGSPNLFSHPTTCHSGRTVGFSLTMGSVPTADYAEAKYMVFIGRNPAEGVLPATLVGMATARENGARMIVVDPRLNNTAIMADEWITIRPGTDLALVLAWANVLIREGLYDRDFIEQFSEGFGEYAQAMLEYTPDWAAPITGIAADTITRIARELAAARPRAFIDPSWHGAYGAHYANSTQTARAVALVNALLGNINRTGGLILPPAIPLGALDAAQHPAPPKPTLARADGAGIAGQYPLALASYGLPQRIPELVEQGTLRAGFIYNYNPARTLTNPKRVAAALRKLDLLVVIDVLPSETALLAHYVLPESMYVERDDVVRAYPGKQGQVVARQAAVAPVADTRPAAQIITELARAAGVGQYFNFTLTELNQALLAPLNVALADLKAKGVLPTGPPWQEGAATGGGGGG